MDIKAILKFLRNLRENNSLSWMQENKKEYLNAKGEFELLVQGLIERLESAGVMTVPHLPKDLTFRLARDTRFSHDKSPYRPAFRAHLSPKGRGPVPTGAYLCLEPDACFLGGGLFLSASGEATALVRDAICRNPVGFQAILEQPSFQGQFSIAGEKLKNVPRGYPKEHALGEYLKHKSWYVEVPISDEVVEDASTFLDFATEQFSLMQPLNDYLNGALGDFDPTCRRGGK